jgi:hypothetical protein
MLALLVADPKLRDVSGLLPSGGNPRAMQREL